jgi:hypothetical protein
MVAGLFAAHGVWTGECGDTASAWNPKGLFENVSIKKLLLDRYGPTPSLLGEMTIADEPPAKFAREVADVLDSDGYRGGAWLVKISGLRCRAFHDFNPIYVTVRRAGHAILQSFVRCSGGHHKWGDLEYGLGYQTAVLDSRERQGALRIDSELLIAREYAQIGDVFARCGVPFKSSIADRWIERELWHF